MSKNNIKEYLSKLGKKGGSTTKERHGSEHFKRISKIGLAKRWGQKSSESAK